MAERKPGPLRQKRFPLPLLCSVWQAEGEAFTERD